MSVPNTNTFSLHDVCDEIFGDHGAGRDLQECFDNAVSGGFDPSYQGSKNQLDDFRNYTHRYIDATPVANTIYADDGSSTYLPTYTVDASHSWYAVDDDSEISGLFLNPGSGSAGTTYCSYPMYVNQNYNSYPAGGGSALYFSSDNSWGANIGACQDGYSITCS